MIGTALSLITGGLSRIWIYLTIAGTVVAGVLAVLAGAKNAGRRAQQVDDLKESLHAETTRRQVDLDVATSSDAERERLRSKWTAR